MPALAGWRRLDPGSPDYPHEVATLAGRHAAGALWLIGDIPPAPRIAIVGTRTPDCAGIEMARTLAFRAVLHGFSIVSGGAAGIDTAAHEAAIEAGGVTLVVLGTAPDDLYPSSNAHLFERACLNGSGLITEVPPGRPCAPHFFLHRNRLLALLGRAVVVVQARHRSGALNTAGWALRFSIPLYAVPGSPLGRLSDGPNRLIASGAASPLVDIDQPFSGPVDARSGCHDGACTAASSDAEATGHGADPDLDPETTIVLSLLGPEPCSPEQVANRSRLNVATVMRSLTVLELNGRVRRHGAAGFCRTPRSATSAEIRGTGQRRLSWRNLKSS